MERMLRFALLIAAAALAAPGCREAGPVELIDDGGPGPIEVVSPPPNQMPGAELGDIDSAGLVLLPPLKIAGQVVVAGARYDGPLLSAEASASRAIFFDLADPVQLSANRVTYHTLDVGSVDLNGTPLLEVEKRARMMGADTLLGVQYVLYNRLPLGFRYTGGALYAWTGTGGGTVAPFTAEITAPPRIVVQNLSPSTEIRLDEALTVRWTGGGESVQLVVGVAGDLLSDARPILHLRLGPNRGRITIPPRIMALLPHGADRLVFSFSSGATKTARIGGYPDDVLVQAFTSHSVSVLVAR
jgi:hypothetical protein